MSFKAAVTADSLGTLPGCGYNAADPCAFQGLPAAQCRGDCREHDLYNCRAPLQLNVCRGHGRAASTRPWRRPRCRGSPAWCSPSTCSLQSHQVHAAPRPLQKCLQWEPSSNAAQRDRSPTGLLDATTATRAASRSSTSGATCSWGSPHSTVEAAEPGCLAVLGYVLTQCTTGSHPRHPAPPRRRRGRRCSAGRHARTWAWSPDKEEERRGEEKKGWWKAMACGAGYH